MTKTENKRSIQISKLDFLDEMLEFPRLESEHDWDTLNTTYSLEISQKFENLIKTIAAKTLSEEELLAVLGNQKRETYWKDSATITYSI